MRTIEGHELPEKVLGVLNSKEKIVAAARPMFASPNAMEHWDNAVLLVTDQRMIVTRERLFGRAKADYVLAWNDVETVSGELWHGGGPDIQLLVHTHTGRQFELIVRPQHAKEIESAIRGGYMHDRERAS
jgi:hypothetical protein